MTRPHAASLSDQQLKLVQQYARAVPLPQRDQYLRAVADRLTGEPTDAAVMVAINRALDMLSSPINGVLQS